MLVGCVIGVMLMCAYVLLGFVGGWKVGGLRTEGEMYACAVWFGIVSVRFGCSGEATEERKSDCIFHRHVAQLFGPFNALSRTVFAEIIPRASIKKFYGRNNVADSGFLILQGHEARFFSLFSITGENG